MDVCVNTADDSCSCDKNLLNFGPITPEVCNRVCSGWAICWASSRISSYKIFWCSHTVLRYIFCVT